VHVPTYPYACTACDHRFEQVQAFSDPSLTECPVCGGRLRKVFSSVGIVFKGSGFYRNDARAGSGPSGSGSPEKASAAAESSSGGTESKGSGDGAKSSGSSDSGGSSSGSGSAGSGTSGSTATAGSSAKSA
jgi:putative FmdB family regulatory protein